MANDALTQQALAKNPHFVDRVKAQLVTKAYNVLAEDPPVAGRVSYARQILNGLDREVNRIVPIIVQRSSIMAFTTSYDFSGDQVITAAGDADILTQLNTDFNSFAGI